DGTDVVTRHPAVYAEHHLASAAIDQVPDGGETALRVWCEALSAPTRIHGQDQYELHVIKQWFHDLHWSPGIERDATADSRIECLENAMRVAGGLDVEGEHVGTGVDVSGHLLERVFDHQMDVLSQLGPQGGDHRRSHRQLRAEAAVHDVDVHEVGAGRLEASELIAHVQPI